MRFPTFFPAAAAGNLTGKNGDEANTRIAAATINEVWRECGVNANARAEYREQRWFGQDGKARIGYAWQVVSDLANGLPK